MSSIRTDHLPARSSLWLRINQGDFLDCYSVESTLTPRLAVTKGLAMPRWVKALLKLRNLLVRPFGLRTAGPSEPAAVGIFPIVAESEEEVVLGFDDRHLDFRITVFRQDERLYMSTWVHPHNLWGRIYLRLVMPFHMMISRGAVARMAG